MLLSDDDKALLVLEHLGPAALAGDTMSLYDCFQLALDVAEKAVLAKLASAELPEPVGTYEEVVGHEEWQGCPSELIEMRDAYSSDQLRQAYAQGVAAQLAEKPSGYLSQYNLEMLQQGYPQTIVMLEGAKRDVPLYTRREAK